MMASGCHAYTWAPAETDGISIRTETKSNGRFWPITAGQDASSELGRSEAINWASRMQMAGQLRCKRVGKWNAILQVDSYCPYSRGG